MDRIGVGSELAELHGLPGEPLEQRQSFTLLGGDGITRGTGMGADVNRRGGEETAAWKYTTFNV